MYDCARANKAMSAWGVEARVPFLDKKFLDVAMRINPQDKMCGNGKMENTSCVNVLKRICLQAWPGGKRAVLRWRRLQLDRHPERSGSAAGF